MSGVADYLELSARTIAECRHHPGIARTAEAIDLVVEALAAGKPVLVAGNGGSAADAQHITGELVGRFLKERRALNCICLSSNPAVLTAWANDYSYDTVFSRQVEAYGVPGAVLIGISTSGNSKNIVEAFQSARAAGVKTIAMTGKGGGKLAALSDVLIDVPTTATPLIQQVHICLYHYMCEQIETRLAG
ncbi:SIS domain-containing protein [Xanthobacteraceae bacterium Astr-EGSB]|uniref:D-sedoheptulose-7-phosphate isomerase n=1 Tax=Astrobacterium formosum TaxID=3069710 RepID=UPI0027B1B0EE|nr:SIS domain-containing protein [Xanthobacteraceae bacterium Astr-EGSB]